MNVQQIQNGADCGLYAIAFAKSILTGIDPTQIQYDFLREMLHADMSKRAINNYECQYVERSPEILKTIDWEVDRSNHKAMGKSPFSF